MVSLVVGKKLGEGVNWSSSTVLPIVHGVLSDTGKQGQASITACYE